jgi:hypothetical protein
VVEGAILLTQNYDVLDLVARRPVGLIGKAQNARIPAGLRTGCSERKSTPEYDSGATRRGRKKFQARQRVSADVFDELEPAGRNLLRDGGRRHCVSSATCRCIATSAKSGLGRTILSVNEH